MTQKTSHRSARTIVGGPYSPAISVGEHVFIAGQGPISPDTGQIAGNTFEEQVELTFQNVEEALQTAGCSLDDCVKVNVYLEDMALFDRLNAIYKQKFREPFPARTTVAAGLWNGIKVEIDAVAVLGCSAKK